MVERDGQSIVLPHEWRAFTTRKTRAHPTRIVLPDRRAVEIVATAAA